MKIWSIFCHNVAQIYISLGSVWAVCMNQTEVESCEVIWKSFHVADFSEEDRVLGSIISITGELDAYPS